MQEMVQAFDNSDAENMLNFSKAPYGKFDPTYSVYIKLLVCIVLFSSKSKTNLLYVVVCSNIPVR